VVVITGNHQSSANDFVATGQITNSVGTNVIVDYNNINGGMTTIYPSGLYIPPAQDFWNPALNPNQPSDDLWNNPTNWSAGVLPGSVTYVNLNIGGVDPCWVTNAVAAGVVRLNQSGATLIITNGGSLTCSVVDWTGVGYNTTGNLLDVEDGGSASFAKHLWIGFNTGGNTFTMNGGTVSVAGMFGLGWSGGASTANINGGTLNLAQWSASAPGSIAGGSVLNITGTGKIVITGNYFSSISNYVSTGQITNSTPGGNVYCVYYPTANTTVVSAVPVAPPPQAITAVSVSGGNVSITYQTTPSIPTPGIQYHVVSTLSLTPPTWTPVTGSTNFGTGAPVTFTCPAGSGPMFYRTVSP
jgi:hypothetical protein